MTKQISINNGHSFISPEEAINNMEWDVLTNSMEDEAREQVHYEIAPCTELEFLIRYLEVAKEDLIIG